MKFFVILGLILFAGSTTLLNAQVVEAEKALRTQEADSTAGWKKGGVFSLNFSQTSLTNWAAGGQNSLSGNGIISLFADYRNKKSAWDNSLDIGYGLVKQGDGKVIKTDDKIDFTSKYGRDAFKNWYYAALVSFKTQMTSGYNYPNDSVRISDFMAPAYLVGALGMDYKPNDKLTVFIAPATGKITFVNSPTLANAGAFGVEAAEYDTLGNVITKGKKMRTEFGGYLRAAYKQDVFENVTLSTKLDLFSNYLDKPQNIDVNWEVLISMKVNKYITATVSTQLIYDDDINIAIDNNDDGIIDEEGPRIQFKEVIGVGFSYKF